MSFVRLGRSQQHSKGKKPVRPKKAAAPRREWVSTVNDLSVHKLTPEELSHRHEIHKSHNKAAAQWELREKALKRRLKHSESPLPLDKTSLRIIREVFSDQLMLHDVLDRSDRAMAVVKDLFGDAPRRQTGHPSVTVAPNCDSDSELPVLQRPDPPTQLSLLSQSMMDQQALNEVQASEEDHSDEDAPVIQRANLRKMRTKSRGKVQQGKRDTVPVTPCTSGRAPDQTALNATVAVQRVRTAQNQSEESKEEPSALVSQVLNLDVPHNQSGRISSRSSRARKCISQNSELDGSSLNGDQSSLGLLQAMLGQVEADLDNLNPDTASGSTQSPAQLRTQGLTGFSVALVSMLGRLVHLLKQTDEKVLKEAEERRRLEAELKEQRALIDAVTAETMTLREEAAALQASMQEKNTELEQKLDSVVVVIGNLLTQTDQSRVCEPASVPEGGQSSVSPAILLSPPRQRDNWQHIPQIHPERLHQQLPPEENYSYEGSQILSSASSPGSFPLASLPSTSSLSLTSDPLSTQLLPEVMLAEIAQLSRQNELIKAQLSQARRSLGSQVEVSPTSTSEQKRRSSNSSGRVTPQSVGERTSTGSNSSERRSKNIQVSDGDGVAQQATSVNVLSVEQRLLELNKQSSAARGRLLELIEQQKRSVSPSASPPSASAHSSVITGGNPEVSMLLPAQTAGGGRRSAASEGSDHRFGRETRTRTTQQGETDGWFPGHMR